MNGGRLVWMLLVTSPLIAQSPAIPEPLREPADDFEARLRTGRMLVESGRPADALVELDVCLKQRPRSLRARLWTGLALSRTQAKGWMPLLTEVAEALPDGWRAHGELALRAAKRGDPKAALGHFESAGSDDTRRLWTTGGAWVGTRFPLLRLTDSQGKPARRIVKRSRPVPELFLFWKSGHPASSRCLEKLESLHWRFGSRLRIVGINVDTLLPGEGDPSGAADALWAGSFESWVDANLESYDRCDLGTIPCAILVDAGGVVVERVAGESLERLERGAAMLEASGQEEPAPMSTAERRAQRYYSMARQLARQGRLRLARDSVREAMQGGFRSAAAPCLLAGLLRASGRLDEAIVVLRSARAADSSLPDPLSVYGHCLLQKKELNEATRMFRRALELGPAHARARRGLGNALFASGKREEGLRELEAAVALDPLDEASWIALGRARAAEQKLDAAVDAYARAYRIRSARTSALYQRGTIR